MFASREYTEFKWALAWAIRADNSERRCFYGRVLVTLRVDLPPRMDTSAIIKAAGDAIQLSGSVLNDGQIERWVVERVGRSPRGQSVIEFRIEEVG